MVEIPNFLRRSNVILWLVWFIILGASIPGLTFLWTSDLGIWLSIFWTVFALRYARFIGHCIGYVSYTPSPILENPTYTRHDVTVILPTIDPTGPDFLPCVESILKNKPHALLVVTVGMQLLADCDRVLGLITERFPETRISTSSFSQPSKRRQIAHAMPFVKTDITLAADDHVFWPENFLPAVLAPFENPKVGIVGTRKRVQRTTPGRWTWASIVNFVACNYLERHNWELRASNALDGGVFVVSGRTAAYRTSFLGDAEMLQRFCSESFFCGLFGKEGLGPDDDNFLTREAMKKGLLIRFQDTPDATIETTLGEWPKFKGQLLRWARTTFRSNPVMLRDPRFFARYTWSYFMVYWAGILNFAIIWDAALLLTLLMSRPHPAGICAFAIWLILTKVVKIIPHLMRHPADNSLVIAQIAFAYTHSIIKFWALVTFWDCDWSGRKLDDINTEDKVAGGTDFHRVMAGDQGDEE
ncbi:nucleotide-diphospho-sugar transferase [Plectosphaerella plurivora]|uniref:Nucleotide-diphospho-sugar transferase n=1 Tax=Plectosphaerella plurivora TaxID=936078 RepID=A0A9P8V8Q2_9PEZI|nr:nucleotide-diphospho-sugar transferase [Plectosphaerella plurivora]